MKFKLVKFDHLAIYKNNMKKAGFVLQIFLTLVLFLAFVWTGVYFLRQERIKQEIYRKGGNMVYKSTDELDIYAIETLASIDYSTITQKNTSMLFGGGNPRNIDAKGWNDLEKVGIKAVRVPLFLEHLFPTDTTLTSYINNEGDIQNPKNWNQSLMKQQTNILKEAKKHGMKTLGIIDYTPLWLNINRQPHGVPADWKVYEELVTKIYAANRDYLDYVTIWNEPDFTFFLNTKGTPYSPVSAYTSIFLHAQSAIREHDKKIGDGKSILVGGPALSKIENADFLDKILQSEDLRKSLDFISIHNYNNHQELDTSNIHSILKEHQLQNIPLFLTEWNYTSDESYFGPEMISDEGSTYAAGQFIDMIRQGITANFFFALQPVSFGQKGFGHGSLAFFDKDVAPMKLLPKAQVWNLFSQILGLGTNSFSVVESSSLEKISSIALINSNHENVLILSNDSSEAYLINIHAKLNSDIKNNTITAYKVSPFGLPEDSSGKINTQAKDGEIDFKILVPANTVIGLKIKPKTGFIL